MEYVLTEPGRQKIADYILQCAAKRKEILDAGIDTADATKLSYRWLQFRLSAGTQSRRGFRRRGDSVKNNRDRGNTCQ